MLWKKRRDCRKLITGRDDGTRYVWNGFNRMPPVAQLGEAVSVLAVRFARESSPKISAIDVSVGVMSSIPTRMLVLTAVCLMTAGCLSSREQLAQRDQDRCVTRGYQPGTDAHADCVTRLESDRDTRMESRRRDMMERSNIPAAATR